jgi:hypothetical protein
MRALVRRIAALAPPLAASTLASAGSPDKPGDGGEGLLRVV